MQFVAQPGRPALTRGKAVGIGDVTVQGPDDQAVALRRKARRHGRDRADIMHDVALVRRGQLSDQRPGHPVKDRQVELGEPEPPEPVLKPAIGDIAHAIGKGPPLHIASGPFMGDQPDIVALRGQTLEELQRPDRLAAGEVGKARDQDHPGLVSGWGVHQISARARRTRSSASWRPTATRGKAKASAPSRQRLWPRMVAVWNPASATAPATERFQLPLG